MAKRKSINGKLPRHENPIPNASRIGNIIMSSVIGGTNPGTRDLPETLEQQVVNVFTHIRHDVEAAGAEHRVAVLAGIGDAGHQRFGRRQMRRLVELDDLGRQRRHQAEPGIVLGREEQLRVDAPRLVRGQVLSRDLADFERILRRRVMTLPGVGAVESNVMLSEEKAAGPPI